MPTTRIAALSAGLALLLLPSCGGGSDETAAAGVPEQLQATWRLDSDTITEPVRLHIRDGSYTISRGGASGSGTLAAEGDELVFSASNLCDGVGRYRWSSDGATLRLETIEEACSGRAPVLDGATYTRG